MTSEIFQHSKKKALFPNGRKPKPKWDLYLNESEKFKHIYHAGFEERERENNQPLLKFH